MWFQDSLLQLSYDFCRLKSRHFGIAICMLTNTALHLKHTFVQSLHLSQQELCACTSYNFLFGLIYFWGPKFHKSITSTRVADFKYLMIKKLVVEVWWLNPTIISCKLKCKISKSMENSIQQLHGSCSSYHIWSQEEISCNWMKDFRLDLGQSEDMCNFPVLHPNCTPVYI